MEDTSTADFNDALASSIESPRPCESISPRNEDDVMLDLSTPRDAEFDDLGVLADDKSDLECELTSPIPAAVTETVIHVEGKDKYSVDNDVSKLPHLGEIQPVVQATEGKRDDDTTFATDNEAVQEFTALVTETEGLIILDTVTGSKVDDSGDFNSVYEHDEIAALLDPNTEHQQAPNPGEIIIDGNTIVVAPELQHVERNRDNIVEEAPLSLENMLVMQQIGSESDSDSEFDFELPTLSTSTAIKDTKDATKASSASGLPTVNVIQSTPAAMQQPAPAIEQLDTHDHQPTDNIHQSVVSVQDKVVADELPSIPKIKDHIDETSKRPVQHPRPVAVIKHTNIDSGASNYQSEVAAGSADHKNDNVMKLARAEWDSVTTVQAGYLVKDTAQGAEPAVVETLPMISPVDLAEYFRSLDFVDVKPTIKTSIERHGLAAIVQFLFGPSKLNRSLHRDRDLIFCIAASPLDNDNMHHMRTLQTIYKCLTGSKFDCPRTGGHWEEIGFQGNDPGTDLRGVGLLGLLNLISFLRYPKTQSIANDVYRLSLHPTQNFPFCLMGINMSRILLQTLREGCLNSATSVQQPPMGRRKTGCCREVAVVGRECNGRSDLLGVVSDMYAGLYVQMYQVWKTKGKTILDSGFVIKDIELQARKNPRGVLRNLDDYLNRRNHVVVAERLHPEGRQDNFVNVCDDNG